jgi:hypothetical protein
MFVSVSVHAPCDAPAVPGEGCSGQPFAGSVAYQLSNTSVNAQGSSAIRHNPSLPYPRSCGAGRVVMKTARSPVRRTTQGMGVVSRALGRGLSGKMVVSRGASRLVKIPRDRDRHKCTFRMTA